MRTLVLIGLSILTLAVNMGCNQRLPDYGVAVADPELLHNAVKKLTDVTVHDIFSPPLVSRAYAYATIAAYEALIPAYPEYRTLAGQLNDLTPIPAPDQTGEIDHHIASLQAFVVVAREMVFSQSEFDTYTASLHEELLSFGTPQSVLDQSTAYGQRVANHILDWAGRDFYKKTRSSPKYQVTEDPARWQPTPPAYLDAIEPFWNLLRPFAMLTSDQFQPPPPTPYSEDSGSAFYREARHVYDTVRSLSENQTEIAAFWDCNPYVVHSTGHAMFATKKMTPGGHWMGITAIANRSDQANFARSAYAYAKTSIAVADGFIASWDEKYRSDLVRPETYINRFIDETWLPVLQTPPFPEYTSGHSVISTAAAVVLTDIFGLEFAFEDTTEVEYGLPARSFSSFIEASEEAAISRLYGGIHYMPAIAIGMVQGRGVGTFIRDTVKMRTAAVARK